MSNMWSYDIKTERAWIASNVSKSDLNRFVHKCDPNAKITTKNIENWILRYVIEGKKQDVSKLVYLEVRYPIVIGV